MCLKRWWTLPHNSAAPIHRKQQEGTVSGFLCPEVSSSPRGKEDGERKICLKKTQGVQNLGSGLMYLATQSHGCNSAFQLIKTNLQLSVKVHCFDCGNICVILESKHKNQKYFDNGLVFFRWKWHSFYTFCLKKQDPRYFILHLQNLHLFQNILRNFHLREEKKPNKCISQQPTIKCVASFQFGQRPWKS